MFNDFIKRISQTTTQIAERTGNQLERNVESELERAANRAAQQVLDRASIAAGNAADRAVASVFSALGPDPSTTE